MKTWSSNKPWKREADHRVLTQEAVSIKEQQYDALY